MTFRPPWKSPPPDLYKLRPVLGYRNHDITKKRAPAWSFVRYIPRPQPKPEVSPSPFQLMVKKKFGKKKRAQDMMQGKYAFITTDGGISKKKMQHRRKKQKNKKRANLEDTTLALTKKQPQDGSSTKERSKKISSKTSEESGRFFVSPADKCDLCFPWMKKSGKSSGKQEDPKSKKVRRSPSVSLVEDDSAPQHHSFLVIPRPRGRGNTAAEQVWKVQRAEPSPIWPSKSGSPRCREKGPSAEAGEDHQCSQPQITYVWRSEPHSGMLLPSGRKVAFTSPKHALPRPQPSDDESGSTVVPHRPGPKNKKSPKNVDHVLANG